VARIDLPLPGRYRGAVFDFDGLLVDSEPGWGRAEERLLARHGHAMTDEDRLATVGRSMEHSVATYAARLGLDQDGIPRLRAELLELARLEYLAGFALQPGAVALLAHLRAAMPIGLASNTERALIDLALTGTPLAPFFDVVVTASDVGRHKPAPDLYLLACERLGVRPSDAVAFEDSVAGVRSAHAAGLTVVAVAPAAGPAFELADIVVASLEDLLPD
jgi:HAD superfamily hydrolase (TIGR01509 family)